MMRRDVLASTFADLWAIAERRARALRRPVLLSWSKLIEPLDPIALFAADTSSTPRILWLMPQTSEAIVGLRCQRLPIQEMIPTPSSALARLAHSWRWHTAEAVQEGPLAPLAFAGCAFDPEDPRIDTWWEPFGNLQAFLPRLAYVQRGELSAQLVQQTVRPDDLVPLTTPAWPPATPTSLKTPLSVVRRCDRVSRAHWVELVETARNAIRRGELRKVVLARAVELIAERPFSLEITLRALAERYPTCTIFAVGIGETVFLGATPERLVKVENGTVMTVALAGSAPRSADPTQDKTAAAQLLTSQKDRHEHALVVEAIRTALLPVCQRLAVPDEPQLVSIANVHHLATPIAGVLADGQGALDVAARLHPTPAVGGTPREAALTFIRAYEPIPRGWYAGALGWITASGDGEFVVGLRSGIVRDTVARLYAGCGIVADSDPAAEWDESEAKLRPMLEVLGGA